MQSTTSSIEGSRKAYTPDQLQSLTIDLLRFPLAIMVVFCHLDPDYIPLSDADFSILSWRGIYNVVAILLSHSLSAIAVPTFFLISGYLFFMKCTEFTWGFYRYKIQRRIHSLIIPYFLWNALAIVVYVLVTLGKYGTLEPANYILSQGWHWFYDCISWAPSRVNWLGDTAISATPFDLPLWFLRDLIVVSLLSPVIYGFVKRLKIWGILLLLLADISRIWPALPGFSSTAFCYFSLGAYLAINRYNIVDLVHRYKHTILPIALVLLLSLTYFGGLKTRVGGNLDPIFYLFGVFAAFYIASELIMRYHIKPNKLLVSSCLFVYAMHYLTPKGNLWEKSLQMLHAIIPGQSGFEDIVCYVLTPFLTAAICIAIYAVGRKFLPKITLIFSGNK
jgi:surface polysaccharide O-acyltransferase-like enzyme